MTKENDGVGWNDLLRFSDLTTLGLLVNGQLHVSAAMVPTLSRTEVGPAGIL